MELKAIFMIDPSQTSAVPARNAPFSPAKARALLRTIKRLKMLSGLASAIALFALIGLYLTYQRFSTLRPIIQAGGQTITLRDYEGTLEQQDSGKVLHDLVSAALIRQAADRAGVLPSQSDVDVRLALIRQRDPATVQAAEANGSLPLLRDQLLAQIALENLCIQNVSVSDAEVSRYYETHQAHFQQHAQARMTLVVADTAKEAEDATDDLRAGIPPEVLAGQKGLHVAGQNGYHANLGTRQGRALAASWKTMQVGEIRTAPLGRQFLVTQLVSVQAAQTRPLEEIKTDVTRLARLEKAVSPDTILAQLYQANPPVFKVDKYAQYFAGSTQARRSP